MPWRIQDLTLKVRGKVVPVNRRSNISYKVHTCICSCYICTECPPLPILDNGDVVTTNGRTYNSVARFSCQTDFLLVGAEIISCLANRTWNGTLPSCEQKGKPCLHLLPNVLQSILLKPTERIVISNLNTRVKDPIHHIIVNNDL